MRSDLVRISCCAFGKAFSNMGIFSAGVILWNNKLVTVSRINSSGIFKLVNSYRFKQCFVLTLSSLFRGSGRYTWQLPSSPFILWVHLARHQLNLRMASFFRCSMYAAEGSSFQISLEFHEESNLRSSFWGTSSSYDGWHSAFFIKTYYWKRGVLRTGLIFAW